MKYAHNEAGGDAEPRRQHCGYYCRWIWWQQMYLRKQSCWRLQHPDLVFLRWPSLINAAPWEWKEIIVLPQILINCIAAGTKSFTAGGDYCRMTTHMRMHMRAGRKQFFSISVTHTHTDTHKGSRHRLSCSSTKLNYSLLSNSTLQGWHGNGNLSTHSATRWHHLPFHFQFRVSFLNRCADSPEGEGGLLHAPQTLPLHQMFFNKRKSH